MTTAGGMDPKKTQAAGLQIAAAILDDYAETLASLKRYREAGDMQWMRDNLLRRAQEDLARLNIDPPEFTVCMAEYVCSLALPADTVQRLARESLEPGSLYYTRPLTGVLADD